MQFNPDNYETVKSRKAKFYADYPDGRITVELLNPDDIMEQALYKACLYTTRDDQIEGLPRGTGTALEIRDKELSNGKNGVYASVNYTSWTENAEESAIGRALDNAGYSGNKKCSREEMQKASHHEDVLSGQDKTKTPNQTQHWCNKHNVAFRKTSRGNYAHSYKDGSGATEWCNEEEASKDEVRNIQLCEKCRTTWGILSEQNGKMVCENCVE